jgi:hypothetical protein
MQTRERVEQFERTPMNKLPALLKELIAKTCSIYGACGEVYIECFMAYAIMVEGTSGGNPADSIRIILTDLIKSSPSPNNLKSI